MIGRGKRRKAMSFTRTRTDEEKQGRIEALYAKSKRLFPEIAELTVEELDGLGEGDEIVLVDVRKPTEQAISMIPGAITSDEFVGSWEQYVGRTVVAYCTIGHRSGLFVKDLHARGWSAFNLKGAILSWTHAGRDLVNAQGATRKVHVNGPKWSLAASGYEPVW
jgi:sodium/bile acid cotransporter 7